MEVRWSQEAYADYERLRTLQPKLAEKIEALILAIKSSPFTGIGKPEPLKGNLTGHWSRRISSEHRLIYRVEGSAAKGQILSIRQCFRHY